MADPAVTRLYWILSAIRAPPSEPTTKDRPLRTRARLLALLLPLAGCSGSGDVAGPDPAPDGPPVVDSFLATDPSLVHGEWTQLRWRIPGASVASISPDVGPLSSPEGGALSVRPPRATTYTLTASNAHGSVTATVSVALDYPAGIYVDSVAGDDANPGNSPAGALKTLGEALIRTSAGGAIFLSAGVYDTPIVIDGPERSVFGGLNPDTFFQQGDTYESWVRPAGAATPLEVRNSAVGTSLFSFVKFDARNGGSVAADVQDSRVVLSDCVLAARLSGSGTALLVHGDSDVQVSRSQLRGGRSGTVLPAHAETRGLAVLDASSVTVVASFVDGGWATSRSSGVDLFTTGSVRLGFNTIAAQLFGSVTADVAAAVRIRAGHPSLGGNILFTRGNAERHAVVEEGADADPAWLLGNLFLSAGTPPYDNFASDGPDPATEEQLNDPAFTNGIAASTYLNRLVSPSVAAAALFVNIDQVDFHLVSPLLTGGANPVVDRGDALMLNTELFGVQDRDVDGRTRPGTASQYDLGADEY